MGAATAAPDTVVFDLGGVLIDWNPRHLYRKLLVDDAAVEDFLARVCTQTWNEEQDAGRPLAEATALLCAEHPAHAALIEAYYGRWHEMLGGAIAGSVSLLERLHARRVPLYALTNWSAETFHHARVRYEFLARFAAIVISGEEKLKKPDPRLFQRLLSRHQLAPERCLFIDDSPPNVAAAQQLGMHAVRFTSPAALTVQLQALDLL